FYYQFSLQKIIITLKESVRRQIGMAITPKGMKHILMAVLKTFAGEEYDYVEPTERLQPEVLFKVSGSEVANLVKH
ncbi:hypothetical protein NE474_16295, partial [Anaerostipes hadrus]|nr:hypothetical protein [Anaerostipes hadrus]